MTRDEIIKNVQLNYDCVLVKFNVYDTPEELYKNEKENLSRFANETEGKYISDEEKVFKSGDKWIYASLTARF